MTRYAYSPALGKNIEVVESDTGVKPKKPAPKDRHVGCPVSWLLRVLPVVKSPKQLAVAIWLWRRRTICGGRDTFSAPNDELRHWGIARSAKYRTLALLEAAGMIAIERCGKDALTITILPPQKATAK